MAAVSGGGAVNPYDGNVPLDLSSLCQDCRLISAVRYEQPHACPKCASEALLDLQPVLDRKPEDEPQSWLCFHCGFKTSDEAEAEAHFGDRDDGEEFKPLCRWWQRMTPEERGDALQDVIQQLNDERHTSNSLRVSNEGLEYQVNAQEDAIRSYRPFKECRSINDVFFVYDSMEGRALAAEERLNASSAPGECSRVIGGELVRLPAGAVMGAEMIAPEQRNVGRRDAVL